MRTANATGDLPTRAIECLKACTDGIQRLQRRLEKLHKTDPGGFAQKSQAGLLRLVYPFRASTLEKLKETVRDLMGHLKLAIQVLLLDKGAETGATVARIEDNVDSIENLVTAVHATILDTQIQTGVAAAGVQTLLEEKELKRLRDVLEWLGAPDPSINHEEARRNYEPGTDMRKQSYTSLLLSMVTELSRGRAVHPKLLAAYENTNPHKPNIRLLEEILITLLQRSHTFYFVIDALDECPESGDEREQVMRGLQRVVQGASDIRVLITSRRETDIEEFMETWSGVGLAVNAERVNEDIDIFVKNALAADRKLLKLPDKTKMEIEHMFHEKSDGMFRWAALQLQSIRNLKILRPSYISTVLHTMPQTLDGTYERILTTIDQMYHDEVRLALEWLTFSEAPLSVAELADACSIRLDDMNELFLDECDEDTLAGLVGILSPLVLIEQEPKLSDRVGAAKDSLPMKFSPARYCQRIRLAHFSVKEYLMSNRLHNSPVSQFALSNEPHADLAQRSPGIHEDPAFWHDDTNTLYWASFLGFPHTASMLCERATFSDVNDNGGYYGTALQAAVFSGVDSIVESLLQAGAVVNEESGEFGTALHAAAYLGRKRMVEILIKAGADVNIDRLKDGETALFQAVNKGQKEIAKMLVAAGARIHPSVSSPLRAAAENWDEAMVRLLAETAMNISLEILMDEVSKYEDRTFAELLVDLGVDVSGLCGPLIEAALVGSEKLVKGLLQASADMHSICDDVVAIAPNDRSTELDHALVVAAGHGHETVVQLLLDAGANPNATDGESSSRPENKSALIQAIRFITRKVPNTPASALRRSTDIVQKLLEAGADIRALDGRVLYEAIHSGRDIGWYCSAVIEPLCAYSTNLVRTLLAHGADANLQLKYLGSVLQLASSVGSVEIVRVLLEHGADVHQQGGHFGNALLAATRASVRNEETIQVLLEHGAEINQQVRDFGDALQVAADFRWDNEDLVRMLLDKGADVNAKSQRYGTALQAASDRGNVRIVRVLLAHGADVNLQGGQGVTALQAAASSQEDNLGVIKILLDGGADVNAQGGYFGTALEAAAAKANEGVVRALLARGVDVNLQGGHYGSAIEAAVRRGHEGIVQMLLEKGAKRSTAT
ncbi:hypothetical protein ONZ43_g7236 [Nemania bipapillata]|uniref:Uncharacterized protein n=1 Tax=Nemania bipapillata TaxID=110536 RepID=A0ACC2HSX2_9PEZI|nr:hypothetical protein ONZ43_g7236 [Nemania bipapillata]